MNMNMNIISTTPDTSAIFTTNTITTAGRSTDMKEYLTAATAYTPLIIKDWATTNFSFQMKDGDDFSYINEIVPNKVYEFTFYDGTKIKTVCDEEDLFNLEYAFYLALAKKLYSKYYTFEGVLSKSYSLCYEKRFVKIVQRGMKLFNTLKEEEQKKKEYDEIKKRQHERYVKRKKATKERKRKNQINIIAEAIRLSKEEG